MSTVAPIRRNLKNVIKNYSEAQVKVREATSNDPWGPSSSLMTEIADYTYNVVAFSEIMQMIWKRLNDNGKNWRHVYKALSLLEYIIKTGNEKVAQQCKENIFTIQTLKDFQYIEDNKDQGLNVREKAKQIVALLKDDERLKNERTRALKAKERFAQSSSIVVKDSENLQQNKDWESARPSNIGEEELQLRLALAMSKEEADKDKKIIQGDDLRLKLALSQSEQDKKDDSGILSDGNPLIDINPEDSFYPWQNKAFTSQIAHKTEPLSLDYIFSMKDERFQDNEQATSSYPLPYNQSSNFRDSQTNKLPIGYLAKPTVPYNSNQLPNISYNSNQMMPTVTHSQSLFTLPHSTSFQSNNPFL